MHFVIRSSVVAAALTVLGVSAGWAADLPARGAPAPHYLAPAPVSTWNGFYVGGNVGYGWGKFDGTSTISGNLVGANGTYPGSVTLSGITGGGQIGYNWQFNQWVAGIEGDWQGSGEKKDTNLACPGCTYTVTDKLTSFATMRARLGWVAWNSGLLYVTGGWAWMNAKHTETLTAGGVTATLFDTSAGKSGWTMGMGYEQMLWDHWSAKLEYLYMQADGAGGTATIPAVLGGGTVTTSGRLKNNVVRIGANYHF